MYLQCHASKKWTGDNNITFYALCILYVLSVAVVALDTAGYWFNVFVSNNEYLF